MSENEIIYLNKRIQIEIDLIWSTLAILICIGLAFFSYFILGIYILLFSYAFIIIGLGFFVYILYIMYIKFSKNLNIILTTREIIIPEFFVTYKKNIIEFSKINAIYVSHQRDNYELFQKYKSYSKRMFESIYEDISFNEWKKLIDELNAIIIEFEDDNGELVFETLYKSEIINETKFLETIKNHVPNIVL